MKTEKSVYSAPKAKLFEVKVQGVFCQSPGSGYNNSGHAGNDMNEDPTYNYSF